MLATIVLKMQLAKNHYSPANWSFSLLTRAVEIAMYFVRVKDVSKFLIENGVTKFERNKRWNYTQRQCLSASNGLLDDNRMIGLVLILFSLILLHFNSHDLFYFTIFLSNRFKKVYSFSSVESCIQIKYSNYFNVRGWERE